MASNASSSGVAGININCGYGVYAQVSDANGSYGTAVEGLAAEGLAGYFQNNSDSNPTLLASNWGEGVAGWFENDDDGGVTTATLIAYNDAASGDDEAFALAAGNPGALPLGQCTIDIYGNLYCTGSKSAVVRVDGGSRKVALYAVEAPENWFEDFGSGQLSNGSARIDLEPTFAQTVNTDLEYHVFLTPRGECEGLYVTNLTPSGSGTASRLVQHRL